MKKVIAILLSLILLSSFMVSCGTENTPLPDDTSQPDSVTTPEETNSKPNKPEDPITTPEETSSEPNKPEEPLGPPAPVDVDSALRITAYVDKASYTANDTITLTIIIENMTSIDQTNVMFGISTPAGVKLTDNKFTVNEVKAKETVTKTVTMTVDETAAAETVTDYAQKADGKWYSSYSNACTVQVASGEKTVTVNAAVETSTLASLVGKAGIATLNTKGSKIAIDDILIVSNSDGSVIYANDFEGADPTADLSYVNFWSSTIPDGYDLVGCWSVVEENGNKIYSLDPGGNYDCMGLLYGDINMRDITYTFKLKDTDGTAQLGKPLFGVFGGDKGIANGYQWVMGGWSNGKTIIQQYYEKADSTGSTRQNIGYPEEATFPYGQWIEVKIVIGADSIKCYADGELYLSHDVTELVPAATASLSFCDSSAAVPGMVPCNLNDGILPANADKRAKNV